MPIALIPVHQPAPLPLHTVPQFLPGLPSSICCPVFIRILLHLAGQPIKLDQNLTLLQMWVAALDGALLNADSLLEVDATGVDGRAPGDTGVLVANGQVPDVGRGGIGRV